jgi:hypothetical protein
VKKYQLDGVDVDYEDFDAINAGDGSAEVRFHFFDVGWVNQNSS